MPCCAQRPVPAALWIHPPGSTPRGTVPGPDHAKPLRPWSQAPSPVRAGHGAGPEQLCRAGPAAGSVLRRPGGAAPRAAPPVDSGQRGGGDPHGRREWRRGRGGGGSEGRIALDLRPPGSAPCGGAGGWVGGAGGWVGGAARVRPLPSRPTLVTRPTPQQRGSAAAWARRAPAAPARAPLPALRGGAPAFTAFYKKAVNKCEPRRPAAWGPQPAPCLAARRLPAAQVHAYKAHRIDPPSPTVTATKGELLK